MPRTDGPASPEEASCAREVSLERERATLVRVSAAQVRCPGCGLELPAGERTRHGYYHASPECFDLYSEVLGSEYQDAVLFGRVHQLTVDAYAVQHAGGPHPDKSVDVHLVGLHLVLERGLAPPNVPPLLQRLVGATAAWPHFEPPADRGGMTVLDVALAESAREHAERSLAWAREVWRSWSAHHAAVARMAGALFDRSGSV
jgi:hypothetical protein